MQDLNAHVLPHPPASVDAENFAEYTQSLEPPADNAVVKTYSFTLADFLFTLAILPVAENQNHAQFQ